MGKPVSAVRAIYRGWAAFGATGGRSLPQGPPIPGSHSHNDSQQHRPLTTALRHGFVSVEADLWSFEGELLVGHDRSELRPNRTLREAYLEPLARLINATGTVQRGYDQPFRLLIDVKNDPETTYPLLETLLTQYEELLVHYTDDRATPGPVSVVMTGNYPLETIAGQRHRLVACDGRFVDAPSHLPVTLMPSCSEPWRDHFRWRGYGRMPAAERDTLRRMVYEVRATGRTARFWGAPVWPARARRAAWRELAAAGADYIGADHLSDYRRWLEKHSREELFRLPMRGDQLEING